jgi:GT2 family glycosyltransferase
VRNVIGCSMAFRRDVFDRVGLFDENVGRVRGTPLGCEETELCIRVRSVVGGEPVQLVPAARVLHHVEPSRCTWSYFRRRCYAEGRSKARVSALQGAAALSSEAAYVRRVLPAALARSARRLPRQPGEWRRVAAIVAGLAATGVGYVRETAGLRVAARLDRAPVPE